MMKQLMLGSLAAVLLGVTTLGFAADAPPWDYLALEWVAGGDIEEGSAKEGIDGYRLDAAKGLGDFAFVRAGSNAYSVDAGGVDIDIGSQQLGIGFHYPLNAGAGTIDPWVAINYERVGLAGVVGTGPGVDVGIRAMVMPAWELAASGKVFGDIDFGAGNDADYTGYTISTTYTIVPMVAIQGSFSNYELEFDTGTLKYKDIFGLGVRLMY